MSSELCRSIFFRQILQHGEDNTGILATNISIKHLKSHLLGFTPEPFPDYVNGFSTSNQPDNQAIY